MGEVLLLTSDVLRLATGWTVRGSNPGGGDNVYNLPRPALGPTQPPIQWIPSLFPRVKQPGRGSDHPPAYRAEVNERVQLYLYSSFGLHGRL
jgi:hypothetical protein